MNRADANAALLRSRRIAAILAEAVRIFGPTDTWDVYTAKAVDDLLTGTPTRALAGVAHVLANVRIRD